MTGYADVVADLESDGPEHLRIRIPPDLVVAFAGTAKRKNLSKQGVIERLLRFWLAQEDVAQSMLVGQVTPADDLIEVVLRRLARPAKQKTIVIRKDAPGAEAGKAGTPSSSREGQRGESGPASSAKRS